MPACLHACVQACLPAAPLQQQAFRGGGQARDVAVCRQQPVRPVGVPGPQRSHLHQQRCHRLSVATHAASARVKPLNAGAILNTPPCTIHALAHSWHALAPTVCRGQQQAEPRQDSSIALPTWVPARCGTYAGAACCCCCWPACEARGPLRVLAHAKPSAPSGTCLLLTRPALAAGNKSSCCCCWSALAAAVGLSGWLPLPADSRDCRRCCCCCCLSRLGGRGGTCRCNVLCTCALQEQAHTATATHEEVVLQLLAIFEL